MYGGKESIHKMSTKLGVLRRCGRQMSTKTRLMLANEHIMSIVQYGCPVWRGLTVDILSRIQKMQNKVARWILNKGRRTRVEELIRGCNWMSTKQLIRYVSAVMLWKITRYDRGNYWKNRIQGEGEEENEK